MIFIGIDVGQNGGLVALDQENKILFKSEVPKIGDKVDYKELFNLLYQFNGQKVIIAIEEVHSVFGASAKANFSFGLIKGVKIGMTEALSVICGYRYILVQPKTWQGKIWNQTDKVFQPKKPNKKTRRVDTKKTSLLAVKRLFPNVDFKRNERCKIQHDGMVDAALIAQYLYMEFR